MNENVSWALQHSIYSALQASPQLSQYLEPDAIYDDIPHHARYPYISFGSSVVSDLSSVSEQGNEHSITLHLFSKAHGKKQAFEIMDAVKSTLHEQSLALSDHHLVNMRCELSRVSHDQNSQSYHGVMRYRVVTEQQ